MAPPLPKEFSLVRVSWLTELGGALSIEEVLEIVGRAVAEFENVGAGLVPSDCRPRMVKSREDVEHWSRRLGHSGYCSGGFEEVESLHRVFVTARARMDTIGPRRGR